MAKQKVPTLKGITQGDLLRFNYKEKKTNQDHSIVRLQEYLWVHKKTSPVSKYGIIKWASQIRVVITLWEYTRMKRFSRSHNYDVEVIMTKNIDGTKQTSISRTYGFKTKKAALGKSTRIRQSLQKSKTLNGLIATMRKM